MMIQFKPEKIAKKSGIRSYRFVVLLIGVSIVLFLLSRLLIATNKPAGTSEANIFFKDDAEYMSAALRGSPSSLIDLLVYSCLVTFSGLFFILGAFKGVQLQWQPESLLNSLQLNQLPFKHHFKNGKEILLLELQGGQIQLAWKTVTGPPRRWKVHFQLKITDMDFQDSLRSLAMLLLMKKDENREDGVESDIFYGKICHINELPRQEYLLSYWLSKNDFEPLLNQK
ncbi:MAG: hypothetical protein ACFFD4_22295 [Candidatus Odinarchaeota archaeon]